MKTYPIIDWTGDSYLNPVPAVYDNGTHIRSLSSITSIAVHHTADTRAHDYDDLALAYAEAATHYTRLGPGLQYHYKLSNLGDIYHVRPLETWLYAVGSSENVSTINIVLDGNFETQQPTREQLEALYQLLENLCEQHPEFPAIWPDVRPHADYSPTACCGLNLRNRIYAIQDKASAQAQLLNQGEFDWPSYQPGAGPIPVIPPADVHPTTPIPTAPLPAPTAPGSTVSTPPVVPPTPAPSVPVVQQTPCAPLPVGFWEGLIALIKTWFIKG